MAKKLSSVLKRINSLEAIHKHKEYEALTPAELIHRDEMERSLHAFILEFWSEVEGDTPFMDNWHIKALCEHLQACNEGKIKILIVNIPFRCMKSLICSVFFGPWIWCHSPSTTFFNLSGGFDLALRDSIRTRRLITSDKYQKYWGDKVKLRSDSNTSRRYENTKGGIRFLKSMKSSSIGFGARYLMVDDPNGSLDIFSDITRQRANEYISSSFGIRSDQPAGAAGALILIQQRLHHDDCTGYLQTLGLPKEKFVHLMLPMEYDPARACVTIPLGDSTEPWRDPRKVAGELLWPERFNRDYVENRLKKFLRTKHNIDCQLQQNPSSQTGGVYEREWFIPWPGRLPKMETVIASWDTALSDNLEGCESALTVWGIFDNDQGRKSIMLLNCVSVRLPHHALRDFIVKCGNNYKYSDPKAPFVAGPRPDIILIENAANGKALIDDLKRSDIRIMGFSPANHGLKTESGNKATSKIGRAHLASSLVYQRFVYLPVREDTGQHYQFADKLLNAALSFPSSGKDIVDSMSQALITIRKHRLVDYRGEEPLPDPREYLRLRETNNW